MQSVSSVPRTSTPPPLPPDPQDRRLPVKAPLSLLPLSEKLAAIRAAQGAARLALDESGEFCPGDTPRAQEWRRLLHEGNALEESFFVYKGREIVCPRVHHMSGDLTTSGLEFRKGEEELFRDDAGPYYLRRTWASEGKTRVHRLSLVAAVLWAIARANPATNDLRIDATRILSHAKEAA